MNVIDTFSAFVNNQVKSDMADFIPDNIEWTETRYSLTTLKEDSSIKLPTIIKITSGYFGMTDFETFSSDEVNIHLHMLTYAHIFMYTCMDICAL